MHSFTSEDLLQYLYKETSTDKTAAIKAALTADWSLREKFELMKGAHQQLDEIKYSPRKQSIDNILQYAEKAMEELSTQA